jgi:type IV pilus assembly protein PilY1
MDKQFSRKLISAASLAAALFTGPALADDTELFVTGFDAPASCNVPNVLFAIDTSLSMRDPVLTQVSWDPDQTFDGCYDSNTIYYSRTGEAPDCESTDRFPKVDNFCAAADERLELVGRYKNLFRGWEEERQRWSQLELLTDPDSTVTDFPVECEADRGVDGDGSNSLVFASDGTPQPWQADSTNEPAWASASNVTIFDGNWLNWNTNPPTVERPRLDVVQEVTKQVIDSMDNMNVAIMKFNYEEGGPVTQAMTELDDTTRVDIKNAIDDLEPDGFTPLSETLYEAGQYFAGRLVDYGNVGPDNSVPPSRLGGAATGTTYNSPISDGGQKSYIIMLSDGEPTRDDSANGKITGLPGFGDVNTTGGVCDQNGVDGQGHCLDDMAEYLFKTDLRGTIDGQQNVITHTIGFTQDLPILQSTAQRGGGSYFRADNTASLTTVLTDLAESFEEDGGLFVAPTIPVNAFNQAQTLGDVFVSVFEGSNTVRWPGNLKKYRIRVDGDDQNDDVEVNLVDRNDNIAVDQSTGFFAESAQSFWSPDRDGNDPTLGGAASQLPLPDNRVLLTNLVSGDLNVPGGANAVTVDNLAITPALLGAPAADRDAVIEWARGADAADEDEDGDRTEPRLEMGDPLHSRPVSIIYGGTEDSPDATVFISTNEGYLHAINASTGEELWSFIPRRLLQRLFTLYTNNESATRVYGLDGEITVTILNNNGEPGISGAERVILLMGMRRGGESVFALDVTDRSRPELLWEIDPSSEGFASLGQTWSTPAVTTVRVGSDDKRVAIFGGGYDTGQDNRSYREDSVGNAVFMVDIENNGALLWSAGRGAEHDLPLDRMRFSIPAELTLLDVDGDGRTDRLYFGDMAAQLWRIDLINGNDRDTLGQGGVLASLGGFESAPTPPAAEIRRFFNAPDVVPVIANEQIFIAINIGSGYRAHPLDTDVDDQFFSVRDFQVFEPIATADYPATPLIIDDLLDVTNNGAPLIDTEDSGWRFGMVLGAGEKVLSEATTFANTVFFTSFTPTNVGNVCEPAGGINRLYQVSVLDATNPNNLDQPAEDFDPADRSVDLQQGGIAPEPVFFFPDGLDGPAVLVGTEQPLEEPPGPGLIRTFWLQREGL